MKPGNFFIMNPINVTLEDIADLDNLYDAFRNAQRGKRFRPDILDFAADPTEKLIEIQNELLWETYEPGPYFEHFLFIPKFRIIHSQTFNDRVVPWGVYQLINPFYDRAFIFDSYACRPGKGVDRARARLQYWQRQIKNMDPVKIGGRPGQRPGEWALIKMDVSKFFYRIDHEVLIRILQERIVDDRVIRLMEKVVDRTNVPFGLPEGATPEDCELCDWLYDRGLAIGNLFSQMFANIYMDKLDQYVKHELHIHMYERYADDMIAIVPSKSEAWTDLKCISDFLNNELHLSLNKKTMIQPATRPVEFCGAIVSPSCIRVRKSSRRHAVKELKAISQKYADGKISTRKMVSSVQSICSFLGRCDTENLLKKIDDTIVFQKNGGKRK